MTSILGTSGRPMVELGGERAHKTQTFGDIVASLQWLDLGAQGSGDGPEAVLALFPASRRMDTSAFVLPAANAFEYLDARGNPTLLLRSRAFAAAAAMGFHPDKATVHRVMDVIWSVMPDLIRMPSDPPDLAEIERAKPRFGIEASVKVNGTTVKEQVI